MPIANPGFITITARNYNMNVTKQITNTHSRKYYGNCCTGEILTTSVP